MTIYGNELIYTKQQRMCLKYRFAPTIELLFCHIERLFMSQGRQGPA